MMRRVGTVIAFLSALCFPWPLTALLALSMALSEPLLPLAVGLFSDTLYYTPAVSSLPMFTLWGGLATGVAFFVRSRLRASIIE
ncbi:MAG: hypothetical protein WAV50_01745 [Minisyncoccia bacterium]